MAQHIQRHVMEDGEIFGGIGLLSVADILTRLHTHLCTRSRVNPLPITCVTLASVGILFLSEGHP